MLIAAWPTWLYRGEEAGEYAPVGIDPDADSDSDPETERPNQPLQPTRATSAFGKGGRAFWPARLSASVGRTVGTP